MFERQAAQTPEAVAVRHEGRELSYGELNKRANQLAGYLRKRGVGPEVLVGICLPRSVEMIVGLLGILKAGGAYVPLDPAYPKQRLEYMLGDTGARLLVTEEGMRGGLPEHGASVVSIDGEREEIGRESEEDVESEVSGDNLAYVIYTSGSTGKPKGVMVRHSSLVNFIEMAKIEYGLKPEDRLLQFASISFDAAAEEIYTCLTLGATLVLRTDAMLYSVPVFFDSCRELGITALDLPTSYWHELTRSLASQAQQLPESIRLVIIGGEKALPERLSAWHKSVPGHVRLMQGYGPTEVTVVATIDDISTPDMVGPANREVPIGRPIGNAQTFILDKNLQPVPIGVAGELHVSGDGLARGYLNRPEATAEKFIPNPFSEEPGARLYRTGDKVRYLPDGRIEFLGRIDRQVKIRGFRIELEEIEIVLSRYPAVQDAAVAARQNGHDDKRLVAYLVADSAEGAFLSDLRHFLRDQLPEYMVPSAFVMLDSMPMTPSGKVNRDALPEPSNNHHEIDTAYVAPRTGIEQTITGVWREVFDVEKLSTHSNFFDLGGHSLSLVRVCSKLREVMNIEISMIDMFRYPTISSLAKFLSQKESELPRSQHIHDRVEKQREAFMRRKQMSGRV
ncbi:MAG: non-ribosomal peptide synthetase [Acidobacteria bacterium]|nr:non-ribosomal peptide synthetase [Acidobacteriota bacterium]